jgi:SagB-type dehydrogenase family enzyme
MSNTSNQLDVEREEIDLPLPELRGSLPLAEALAHRRSRREFAAGRPTPAQVAQLCWAAQGITEGEQGLRTAPSAGATYPIALFVVEPDGVYRYEPSGHRLRRLLTGDVWARLQAAAEDQPCVGEARLCLVLAVEVGIVAARYGRRRGWRYGLLEAGHVAQNVLLQATALGLAGVPVGAFEDRQVAHDLGLRPGLHPVYLLPIGVPSARVPRGGAS